MSESRDSYLKRTYGMSANEYETLFFAQAGTCAICRLVNKGRDGGERPLVVDHSHRSGANRGLLCDACNKGLGCFKDCQELLLRALIYLREHDGAAMSYQPDVSTSDSCSVPESSSQSEQVAGEPQ